jgi:pentatricopeptide repeat protein
MLHPASPQLGQTDKTITPVKPSVRTWTLLLSSFIFHRQIHASEKIREMMDKHNVQYSDVTWNTIINGYANVQNIPETAAAIKAMEQQGFSIDSYTMKSLRYLRDPERLWVAIDELDRKATETSLALDTLEPEFAGSKEEERDQLIDSGLEKLGSKMKPQS